MIETQTDFSGGTVGRIVIRPNQSFTWQASKYFLILLSTLSLVIALSFLFRGYWLVLPFSVLEVSIVVASFILILRRAQKQQVVAISTDHIRVEEGHREPERIVNWQRYFTKVVIEKPSNAWYSSTIKLRHNQEEIELGWFLNSNEKEELISALRKLINLANNRQVQS